MCQPKPGPRCAAHTRTELRRAQKAFVEAVESGADTRTVQSARDAVAAAQREFDSTPTGQRDLEAAIASASSAFERADLRTRFTAAVTLREEQVRALAAVRARERRAAADGRTSPAPVVVPDGPTREEGGRLFLSRRDAAQFTLPNLTPAQHVERLGEWVGYEYDAYECTDCADGYRNCGVCSNHEYVNLRPDAGFNDPRRVADALLNTNGSTVPQVVVDKVEALGLHGTDHWDTYTTGSYYGEDAHIRCVREVEMMEKVAEFRRWFETAANANDSDGVLAYVRSKGTVTQGLSAVAALKAQLADENDGRVHPLVQRARTVRPSSMLVDAVAPGADQARLRQVAPQAPRLPEGAADGTLLFTGVLVVDGSSFRLVDGHRRLKSALRRENPRRPFIVLQ